MKYVDVDFLPNLDISIKELIEDRLWNLYSIENPDASFMIHNPKNGYWQSLLKVNIPSPAYYFFDNTGNLINKDINPESVKIIEEIIYQNINSDRIRMAFNEA